MTPWILIFDHEDAIKNIDPSNKISVSELIIIRLHLPRHTAIMFTSWIFEGIHEEFTVCVQPMQKINNLLFNMRNDIFPQHQSGERQICVNSIYEDNHFEMYCQIENTISESLWRCLLSTLEAKWKTHGHLTTAIVLFSTCLISRFNVFLPFISVFSISIEFFFVLKFNLRNIYLRIKMLWYFLLMRINLVRNWSTFGCLSSLYLTLQPYKKKFSLTSKQWSYW